MSKKSARNDKLVVIHSDDSMEVMCLTAKNAPLNITPKKQRRTTRFLTKFEVSKVISERAKQIACGFFALNNQTSHSHADCYTGNAMAGSALGSMQPVPPMPDDALRLSNIAYDVEDKSDKGAQNDFFDPVALAKLELFHKKMPLPFVVRRTFPNGIDFEDIPVTELFLDPATINFDPIRST